MSTARCSGYRTWIGVVIGLLLAAGSRTAQSNEPRARETWEVVRSGDSAFGSVHTVIEDLPGGGQRIERQTRYLIDLLGQRQEIKDARRWIVDDVRCSPASLIRRACPAHQASWANAMAGNFASRRLGGWQRSNE